MNFFEVRLPRLGHSNVSFLLASIIALCVLPSTAHAATATQSGNWSDSATWGGSAPSGTEEDVTIPSGFTVTLDMSDEVGELKVMGKLTVATGTYELICDSLIVMGTSAEFEVGTNATRYLGDFTLTLKGESSENFVHSMNGDDHDMGARALVALMGGIISIHGEDRDYEWTHLNATVSTGATQITLSDAVDWEVGDVIVITASTSDWTEVETATVSSVANGGLTVNLSSPLANDHLGVIYQYTRPSDSKDWYADMRAEVGLLSRNITIQGAADSVAEGFGAHVMIHGPMVDGETTHPSGEGYIKGVEIYRGGQKSLLARYPFHWHLVQASGSGQYFSDNAVHESFNRGITIHGTDYATVENNIFYDHIGHGVFLEDGSEFFNVIRYNLVALTKRPAQGEEVTPSDNSDNESQNRTPASYWITNPNNTFEYNVAAGTEGTGYWFIFPQSVIGLSANLPYYSGRIADEQPLGSFFGNKAHSTMNGLDMFDALTASHGIKKNAPWMNFTDRFFDECTWYANGDAALYCGTNNQKTDNIVFRDNVFVDNKHVTMFAANIGLEESLVVADSGEGLLSGERFLWRTYDGAGFLRDSYLVGWDASDTNLLRAVGAATKRPNHRFSGIETDHSGTMRASLQDFDVVAAVDAHANHIGHPRFWQSILRDDDGTLTGTAGASAISNHPFMRVGDETLPSNWTNVYKTTHKFALLTDVRNDNPAVGVARTKPGTTSEYFYDVNGFQTHHQLPLIVDEDYLYTYTYTSLPIVNFIQWQMSDTDFGAATTIRLPDFGGLSGLSVTGTPSVAYGSVDAMFSDLSTDSGYFVDGNGDLYLRFVGDSNGDADLRVDWSSGSLPYNGAVDTDLDGLSNDTEGGPSLDSDGDGVPDYLDANSDGDGLSDTDEVFYALDSASATDLRFEFGEFGAMAWERSGTAVSVNHDSSGAYEVVNGSGSEPYLVTATGLYDFSGDDVSTIKVRYESDGSGQLLLAWGNEVGPPDASRFVLATTSYTANSGYAIAEFDVGTHAQWAGHDINQLALRVINAANATTHVDWIRAGTQSDLSSAGPTDIVYVDFGYGGPENGSSSFPWNLLQEALDAVDADGLINIIKNSGHDETVETFSGGGTISQPVTIDAPNGTVTIGTP